MAIPGRPNNPVSFNTANAVPTNQASSPGNPGLAVRGKWNPGLTKTVTAIDPTPFLTQSGPETSLSGSHNNHNKAPVNPGWTAFNFSLYAMKEKQLNFINERIEIVTEHIKGIQLLLSMSPSDFTEAKKKVITHIEPLQVIRERNSLTAAKNPAPDSMSETLPSTRVREQVVFTDKINMPHILEQLETALDKVDEVLSAPETAPSTTTKIIEILGRLRATLKKYPYP